MRRPGRHHGVFIRCTAAELEAIRSLAYASGYDSPAAWVRAMVARLGPQAPTESPPPAGASEAGISLEE